MSEGNNKKNDEKVFSITNSTMRSFTNKKGVVYKYDPWTKIVYNPKTGAPLVKSYSASLINQHKKQLGNVEKVHNRKTFLAEKPERAGHKSRIFNNRRVYQVPDRNGEYIYKYGDNMRRVPKQTVAKIQAENLFGNDFVKQQTLHVLGRIHSGLYDVMESYKMNKSNLGIRNHFKDGRTETFMNQKEILNFFNSLNADVGFFRETFLPHSDLVNLDDVLSNDQWEELYQKQKKGGYAGVDVFLTKISEISAVEIIDFRDGKEHLLSQYKTGFFFDRYNETGVDLSLFQVYSRDQFNQMVANKDTVIEDCFIHALRQYGYTDNDFAKLYLHVEPPFSAKKVLPIIAKLLNCYFQIRRTRDRGNGKIDYYIIPKKLDTSAKRAVYEKEHNITLKKVVIGNQNNHWFADDVQLYSPEIKQLLKANNESTFYGLLKNKMDMFSTEIQGNTQFYLQAQKLNHTYNLDFEKIDPSIDVDAKPSLTREQIQTKYKTLDNILYLNEINQRIDGVFTQKYSFLYKNKFRSYEIKTIKAIKKAKRFAIKHNLIVVYRVGSKISTDFNQYIKNNNLSDLFKENTYNGVYKSRNVDTTRFYFADFECFTQNKSKSEMNHEFAMGVVSNLHDSKLIPFYSIESFLDYLPENSKVFFHNLKYDHTQIIGNKNVTVKDRLMVSGSMLSSRISYFGKTIFLQDSYKMISSPLSEFSEMFKLKAKKEAISFILYNKLHWRNTKHTTVNKFMKQMELENKDKDVDRKVIKKFLCYKQKDGSFKEKPDRRNNKQYINYFGYMEYYCKQDVNVLKQGWIKFREWNIEAFDIDIANYYTIGSLARDILEKNLCFEECFTLNSISKAYVRNCLTGGRTMTKGNKKIHVTDILLAIDATSLYPTSMRLGKGFAKGKPTFYRQSTTENLQQILDKSDYYLGYFEITNHPKKDNYLDQPVLSYINKDGVRMFTNELPEDPVNTKPKDIKNYDKYVWTDQQTIEDAIEFQGYEFKPIHTMVWNEGFNTNIHDTIQNMFDTRVTKKIEDNPAQLIFKLIMNSSYGKLSMKDIMSQSKTFKNYQPCLDQLKIEEPGLALFKPEDIHKFKDHKAYRSLLYIVNLKKQHDAFVAHNFFHITQIETTNFYTHYTLRKNSLSESQNANYPHLAVYVLSYSKHLMNQVVESCRATDVEIMYGDTDSLHVKSENVPKMYEYYKKKYNHDLTPENEGLGGFTDDYETQSIKRTISSFKPSINDDLLERIPLEQLETKTFNGWSIDSYFFDKKAYLERIITREKQVLCQPELTDDREKVYIKDKDGNYIPIVNEEGEPDYVYKFIKNEYNRHVPIKDENGKKIKMCDPNGNQLYICYDSLNIHLKGIPKTVIIQKAMDLAKQTYGDLSENELAFQGGLLMAEKFDQGIGIQFDLAKRTKGVCMEFNNDTVKNHTEGVFMRKVIFNEKLKEINNKEKKDITKEDEEFIKSIVWL